MHGARRPPADGALPGAGGPWTAPRSTDEALLAAHLAGRSHAFDLLAVRHGARVRAYARRILGGDGAAADDVTQEAFLALLQRPPAPAPGAALVVWLLRVARNAALDHMRRRGRIDRLKARVRERVEALARRPGAGREHAPHAVLAQAELVRAFEEAVRALPETRRSVFLLREVEGLSYEEISEVVGCSPKTVSTRLARARAALREELVDHLNGPPPSGATEDRR